MAKSVSVLLGIVFVLVGIAGFFKSDLLGAHLTMIHNVIHLASGVIALWIGGRGTMSAAKTFCIVFGLVYLGLGAVGFVAGDKDNDRLLTLIPDQLMFGTRDHLIHVVLGSIFLIAGLATKAFSPATSTPYPR